ncbi:MAG TPA: preprotein translocase subunit SecG [Caulobacteraceae bacterium]|jgi:preprotein translocase subunit SecG
MLSNLLIIIDIVVCVALIAIVLLQRSEGGALGMGGGPTGMISARGAGDLLTRTTWILFGIFLALSLGLTLLSAHDRATSSVLEKLKLQTANTAALNKANESTNQTAPGPLAPAPTPAGGLSGQPFLAPPTSAPQTAAPSAPLTAPAPQPILAGPTAAKPKAARTEAPKPAAATPPPTLDAPAPKPVTSTPAKGSADAPASSVP